MSLLRVTPYDTEVYQEQLKDFLPDTFVDCHTHIWLEEQDSLRAKMTVATDYRLFPAVAMVN